MARNRVIGANNRIPWHLPDELKMFKQLTMGHYIVMGRKTYESIGRLLPGRTTVILTRNPAYVVPGAIIAHSFGEALDVASGQEEIFVIGGADLFREALPVADRIHLSVVDGEPAGDTLMPHFDRDEWHATRTEQHAGYSYTLLERDASRRSAHRQDAR